jgi:uncharacterized membrane protein
VIFYSEVILLLLVLSLLNYYLQFFFVIVVEALTAVTIKSALLWDISPCSLAEVHRGRRVSEEINVSELLQEYAVLHARR